MCLYLSIVCYAGCSLWLVIPLHLNHTSSRVVAMGEYVLFFGFDLTLQHERRRQAR